MKIPFVKLLSFGNKYYIYDVNKNNIVKVSYESYLIMQNITTNIHESEEFQLNNELMSYYQKGYFNDNQIDYIKNIDTEKIMDLLDTSLKSLLIQVTRDCNLRCKYCFYSGKYKNIRTHEKIYMKQDLCYKIIDYFMHRSSLSKKINIGFYGGEPLLNFSLIKSAIDYIETNYPSARVQYSITTNGVLLTPTIIDYLKQKEFLITLSIDGPQKIHDANRVFVDGNGSYDILYKNIKYIYDHEYDYFVSNVRYNAVITENRNVVEEYFEQDPIFKHIKGKLSSLNNYHSNSITQKQESTMLPQRLSQNTNNKNIRMLINYLKKGSSSIDTTNRIEKTFEKLNVLTQYPLTSAIGAGICIPGISRLFCTVHGDYYMCEKLDDNSKELKIGDIYNGWMKDNIEKLANISNSSKKKGCRSCWAIHLCDLCAAKICAIPPENLNAKCDEVRKSIEYDLINICKLHELKKRGRNEN